MGCDSATGATERVGRVVVGWEQDMTEFPRRDAAWVPFSRNFAARLVAEPETYNISQAAADSYAELAQQYAEKFAVADNPSTRTSPALAARDEVLVPLERATKTWARFFKGQNSISNEKLIELGLRARQPRQRHGPYEFAPSVSVVSVTGNTVRVRFRDLQSPSRRGKPPHQRSIRVLVRVGGETNEGTAGMTYFRTISKPVANLEFPVDVPMGTVVWISGQWMNSRGEGSPLALAVYARLIGGSAMIRPTNLAA